MGKDGRLRRRARLSNVQALHGLADAGVPLHHRPDPENVNIDLLVAQLPRRENLLPSSPAARIEHRPTVTPLRRVPITDDARQNGGVLSFLLDAIKKGYQFHLSFVVCVLLPIVVATIYYGLIASNQYVAEFRFAVKDASAPASSATGGLLAILGTSGGSVNFDNYLVVDYLTSRQAAEELDNRIKVRNLYSRPEADWWARFDRSQPMEKFAAYWQKMITANYDMVTGIATAQVRAFMAEEALLIANWLVTLSEELVNRIASRTQNDAVRFAQKEVERAEERLKNIRAKLTEYRAKFGVIDPTASIVASNSMLVQTLQASLAQMETQFATLAKQNLDPKGPAVQTLKNQINSTREQLESVRATIGNSRDGIALSSVMAEYEQLDLERQFAQNMVTSTMQALDQARANAAAQHLYITPYVRPSLPESSTYPRRLLSIAIVGALAFVFWVCGLLVVRSIRERFS